MSEEFCMDIRKFAEKISKAVSVSLGDSYQVKLQEVIKNNGIVLQGLVILEENQNISPTIYLNSFLKMYERGSTLQEIVRQVLRIYREDTPVKSIDMTFFREFEQVKDKICYRLINREKNQALLERIPHVDFLDLSICFFYAFQDERIGSGTILIYNNHVEMWGSSIAELMRLAQKNTPKCYPYKFRSMDAVFEEMAENVQGKFPEGESENGMGEPPEKTPEKVSEGRTEETPEKVSEERTEEISESEPGEMREEVFDMYVLTNSGRTQGASCILYPELLRELSDQLADSFYILPSSVHEVILIPSKMLPIPGDLRRMICEVNSTQVEPEDILSDNLYFYDAEKSRITIE